MIPSSSEPLEGQLQELRSRVLRLEETLRAHGISMAEAEPRTAEASAPAVVAPVVARVAAQPALFASFEKTGEASAESLESRIGSQWFNRIGILAVLVGMAWFLKLAIDNHWIGPAGRVLVGVLAGGGLIVGGQRMRARGYAAFSYSLNAVGSGTLYLSLWAAFQLYHLVPSGVAFALMVAVTAFNGYLAWAQDSELLALYSIAGCLSTPLLLSTGDNHEIALFSYLLLMDVAVLVLATLRPWSRLLFAAFFGTVLFVFGWWWSDYTREQALRTGFFVAAFFLIFAFGPRMVRPNEEEAAASPWDALVQGVLPGANAAFGFCAFYALFARPGLDWFKPWLAVLLAAFYLLLARLPQNRLLRPGSPFLLNLHLATAVVFLTIAIPLKAHGHWLTIGWLAEGVALVVLARRHRSFLLQTLAVGCLALGLLLLVLDVEPVRMLIFNARFATYAFAIAAFAFSSRTAFKAHGEGVANAGAGRAVPLSWQGLSIAYALLTSGLILLAVSLEIDTYWWQLRWYGDGARLADFRSYAQFSYSAWCMLYGAALLAVGLWRKLALLRWQALVLLAVAIGKVFLVDVSALSQGFRIVSFLGLGGLLLAVSFVYQRDWLRLRAPFEQEREP